MTIYEEIQKKEQQDKEICYAVKMYKEQKKAIQWIWNTKGFEEIIKYFKRETEWAKEILTTCKKEDLAYIQARYWYANGFLTFLNNLSKS